MQTRFLRGFGRVASAVAIQDLEALLDQDEVTHNPIAEPPVVFFSPYETSVHARDSPT